MTPKTRRGAVLAAGVLAVVFVGGCSNRITADSVRSNMSPELETVAMTAEQRKNLHARVVDTDLRQIPDDIDTLFLLNRPVRMTRYPVP